MNWIKLLHNTHSKNEKNIKKMVEIEPVSELDECLLQFVGLVELVQHCIQVHVHLFVVEHDPVDSLAHSVMELVVAQLPVVSDIHVNLINKKKKWYLFKYFYLKIYFTQWLGLKIEVLLKNSISIIYKWFIANDKWNSIVI